jgi:hypothetical protein
MNPARRDAMRLALYLRCIGVEPMVSGHCYKDYRRSLNEQILSFDREMRREARRRARKLIREAPGLMNAAAHLLPPLPPAPLPEPSPGQSRRSLERQRYRRRMLLWPPETPPCKKCRMRNGLRKRSWPSWHQAEQIRRRHNEPLLQVYECPVQPGMWHLGHRAQKGRQTLVSSGLAFLQEEAALASDWAEVWTVESADEQFADLENDAALNEEWSEISGDCNESQPCRGDEAWLAPGCAWGATTTIAPEPRQIRGHPEAHTSACAGAQGDRSPGSRRTGYEEC